MKHLLTLCLIPALCLLQLAAPPENKLNLQLTLPQAQMVLQALNECDCPQIQAKTVKEMIISEYQKQFPQGNPADSTKKH